MSYERHLACPAYPNCDEWPNGCRARQGDSVEEAGHRDDEIDRLTRERDEVQRELDTAVDLILRALRYGMNRSEYYNALKAADVGTEMAKFVEGK